MHDMKWPAAVLVVVVMLAAGAGLASQFPRIRQVERDQVVLAKELSVTTGHLRLHQAATADHVSSLQAQILELRKRVDSLQRPKPAPRRRVIGGPYQRSFDR